MAPRAGLDAEAVLRAAAEVADREGLENLTMRRVADAVGVRVPSLYEHVDGVSGLRQGLRLRGFQTMADRFRRATVGKARDDAVRALAVEFRRFVQTHPALYQSTVLTIEGDSPEVRVAGQEVLTTLTAILDGYGIGGEDLVHAARYVRSLLHGFASLESGRGFGLPVDVDGSYEKITETLVRDLRRWAA